MGPNWPNIQCKLFFRSKSDEMQESGKGRDWGEMEKKVEVGKIISGRALGTIGVSLTNLRF
jgi:hypothetical protein